MTAYFFRLIQPEFIQSLVMMTIAFLLPLKREKLWNLKLAGLVAGAVPIWCGMSVLGESTRPQSDLELLLNLVDSPSKIAAFAFWFVGYFGLPLLFSWLAFRLCAGLDKKDSLYGMACAYVAQHASFCLCSALWGEFRLGEPVTFLLNWMVILLVGRWCYTVFAQKLPRDGRFQVSCRKAVFTTGMVLFIALALNYMARIMDSIAQLSTGSSEHSIIYSICMIYDLFSCLFVLWLQTEQRREVNLQANVETERRLRRQLQEQYELSRENIGIINQKCHDIKHQIAALRLVRDRREQDEGLQEIERSVLIYDAVAKTGNEVLDTVLTEKSLLCERSRISWTCMAEGSLLDFMSPVDIYTLFGNALDNAIEGSRSVRDPEQRNVSVTVQNRHGAAFIQVENYFDHPILLENGLPLTSKADRNSHGFGVKSIHAVVERYGGTMVISTEDDIFLLSILIPRPIAV